MSVARVAEIILSSSKSIEDAIQQGTARAVKLLKKVEGAWVKEQNVTASDGKVPLVAST